MFRSKFAPTRENGILSQKGITGLETAIVLIAFVVVASVFAFTILSAGVFSSEANKQTIHAGLKETRTRL
ncbi:MAG: archaellin/type IV pilin N-terminal domain-containing protein, partial [Dehalococcoidia bacterium]